MGSTGSMRERLRTAEARAATAEAASGYLAAALTAAHAEATGTAHDVQLEQLPPHRRRLVEDIRIVRQWAEHLEREVARLGGTDRLPTIARADTVDVVLGTADPVPAGPPEAT